MKKHFLAMLLAFVMVWMLLPTMAFAAPATPALEDGDSIYLGEWNGEPIKWRVLDADKTNADTPGTFLISEYVLGDAIYASAGGGNLLWQDSIGYKWCQNFAAGVNGNGLSDEETAFVLPVTKDEESTFENDTGYRDADLESEKVFFVSVFEAADYFKDADDRIAKTGESGTEVAWMLRTAHLHNVSFLYGMNTAGTVGSGFGNGTFYPRPALNLDLSKVILAGSDDEAAEAFEDENNAGKPVFYEKTEGNWVRYTGMPDPDSYYAKDYSGTYDAQAHGIKVTAGSDAVSVKYGETAGTYDLDTAPEYTSAGDYTVYFCIEYSDHTQLEGSRTVSIGKKAVEITWPTVLSFKYDGTEKNVTPEVTGLIEGDAAGYETADDVKTDIGNYTAAVTFSGDAVGNYSIIGDQTKAWSIAASNGTGGGTGGSGSTGGSGDDGGSGNDASLHDRENGLPDVSFTDIDKKLWYYDGIDYCVKNGLMKGINDTQFDPYGAATRGMLVTVLYRIEGEPETSGASSFADVKSGDWYADAVAWGESTGVVKGYGNGLFGPNDALTREQFATIMYRYAAYKGEDISASVSLSKFVDCAKVSTWAESAVKWAAAEELIIGDDNSMLDPLGTTQRCEAAEILYRYCEKTAEE